MTIPPLPVPPENQITEEKRVLGKILFWDEQLSSDNTIACGTCHLPSFGGADPRLGAHPGPDGTLGTADDTIGSPGMIRSDAANAYLPDDIFMLQRQKTSRAAPSFFGMTQYAPELFWDGRAANAFIDPQTGAVSIAVGGALESQAVGPILSSAEMGHDGRTWTEVVDKLRSVTPLRLAGAVPADMAGALQSAPGYPALFAAAFGDPVISAERIGMALATYERTLVPDQTPFDLFVAGDPTAMTPGQIAGWNKLRNGTQCLACHKPPQFTDHGFHNLGLRPAGEDPGRMDVTGDPGDFGRFKTPSLRNVGLRRALTHVGWVDNVKDAIDFYNAPAFPASALGHTQFTANQTGIPTPVPGMFVPLGSINVPLKTPNGQPFQAPIIDFLTNALTDPRVAAEAFPFDRPTLHSELSPSDPMLYGPSSAGPGNGPRMIARTPLTVANPDFKIGLARVPGGALAWLGVSLAPAMPGIQLSGGAPLNIDLANVVQMAPTALSGAGPTGGFGTVQVTVGSNPALVGIQLFGQWFVMGGQGGQGAGPLRTSRGARWTGN